MSFTDIFIRRPVLATVVSLLILLVGLASVFNLSVRQYPEITNTTLTITTAYPGANAELIRGFITTPIQSAVASAEGIDTLTSSSQQNVSTVTLNLRLDANADRAVSDVLSKVQQVKNILPREAQDPIVTRQTGDTTALMYMSFNSKVLTASQITDYLTRVIQPRLQTIDGVANAQILGGQTFAMRIWLNPDKMASLAITPLDVRNALTTNNFVTAAGQVKGDFVQTSINARTLLDNAGAFGKLVVATRGDALIRLDDIADIELGPESADSSSVFDGLKAVFIGVFATPAANPLTVIGKVREAFPDIQRQLPTGMEAAIAYDATKFIEASIREVRTTLVEAALIVIVVIFLFLGNLRSTLIPIVTIPLSLIGVMFALLALGYSINLLTLLALVLAIGLVVDDAIVVVENIHRHIEEGMQPHEAAITGAREIAVPVMSMTITLAAVYAPIGFVSGLTGALFREFAFTLAGAVIVSGIVALTLSPMMASKLLKAEHGSGRFVRLLDRVFSSLRRRYEGRLHRTLDRRPATIMVLVAVMAATAIMYITSQKELAPEEDQGILFNIVKTPQPANLDYLEQATAQLGKVFQTVPEKEHVFTINGLGDVHQAFSGILFKPWEERTRSQKQILASLQGRVASIANAQVFTFPLPSLPGSRGGPPVQFVITTTADYTQLAQVLETLKQEAQKTGMFIFIDSDLKIRDAADRDEDRPRQGQSSRDQHAGHRRFAGDIARRQLREPVQPVRPQLQSDSAGAARVPAHDRLAQALPGADQHRYAGAAVERGHDREFRAAQCADHLPAAQLGDPERRSVSRPHRGRGDRLAQGQGCRPAAGRLLVRLPGREPAVRAGGEQTRRHVRVRPHHHLSGAGGAVRELPRSADHPDRVADGDVRRADPAEPRAGQHQHLYAGGARHADRAHLQARHPHGGLRQPPAGERGLEPARGDPPRGRHSLAAHSHDDGGDGGGHAPAADRQWRRRGEPVLHRAGDCLPA